MVESVLTAYHKVMLTREPGIQQWFKKNHAVFWTRPSSQETWIWQPLLENALAGSIWCLTAGKQAELEAGWLSACPYAPGLSQISCSQKWLTDPLDTALKGRALFSASGLVNEWKGSPRHRNCYWPKEYRKYTMKDGFEMYFSLSEIMPWSLVVIIQCAIHIFGIFSCLWQGY